MIPLLLLACASERGPRAGDGVAEFDGYIFRGPSAAEEQVLDTGEVVFHTADGDLAAEQPFEDYPGYWRVDIPVGVPYELTLRADDAWPVRWAGTAPGGDGAWFSGALFAGDLTLVDELLSTLGPPGHESMDPADTSVTHVVGSAWDAEAWDCARLRVNDAPATCYAVDAETGIAVEVTEGPLSYFVSLGLPAGPVTVDSGLGGVHTYAAEGGEIVYAFWFQGAPS